MKDSHRERMGLINRRIKELLGIYKDAIRQLEVPESEFWIWYTLTVMEGEYTQQDICRMWSLPKQTVNTVISRLKRRKQAYLEVIPGTKNHKRVRLTPLGRRVGEQIVEPVTQTERRVLDRLPKEDIKAVVDVFERYIEALREEFCGAKEGS